MGVAAHQLLDQTGCHLVDAERRAFVLLRDPRLERHLQQQVAELFANVVMVARLDGLDDFVSLLEEVGHQALLGLLSVPGAAAR